MAIDPPWRLDPLKRIVGVGWRSGEGFLVLKYQIGRTGAAPGPITLSGLPWTSETYNLSSPAAFDLQREGKTVLFKYAPKITVNEGVHNLRGLLYVDLGALRSLAGLDNLFKMDIELPISSGLVLNTQTFYWLWSTFSASSLDEAFEHPFTTGNPSPGGTGIVTIPLAFGDAGEASAALANIIGGGYTLTSRSESTTLSIFGTWLLQAATYKTRKEFPVDANNDPEWDESEAEATAIKFASNPQPAVIERVAVDHTDLAVTITP